MLSHVHELYHAGTLQNLQPQSPDLTPLDVHLWDCMKNMMSECEVNRKGIMSTTFLCCVTHE